MKRCKLKTNQILSKGRIRFFFNVQGQRDMVRFKLWEDIFFDVEDLFLKVYAEENDTIFML